MIPEIALDLGLDLTEPVDWVVSLLVDDVTDRRGFGQAWDQCDDDIKREIVQEWRTIVQSLPQN